MYYSSYGESLQCLHHTFLVCTPRNRHLDYLQRHLPDPDVMLPMCYPGNYAAPATATETPAATTSTTTQRQTTPQTHSTPPPPWQPAPGSDVNEKPNAAQGDSSKHDNTFQLSWKTHQIPANKSREDGSTDDGDSYKEPQPRPFEVTSHPSDQTRSVVFRAKPPHVTHTNGVTASRNSNPYSTAATKHVKNDMTLQEKNVHYSHANTNASHTLYNAISTFAHSSKDCSKGECSQQATLTSSAARDVKHSNNLLVIVVFAFTCTLTQRVLVLIA